MVQNIRMAMMMMDDDDENFARSRRTSTENKRKGKKYPSGKSREARHAIEKGKKERKLARFPYSSNDMKSF